LLPLTTCVFGIATILLPSCTRNPEPVVPLPSAGLAKESGSALSTTDGYYVPVPPNQYYMPPPDQDYVPTPGAFPVATRMTIGAAPTKSRLSGGKLIAHSMDRRPVAAKSDPLFGLPKQRPRHNYLCEHTELSSATRGVHNVWLGMNTVDCPM
jgi:hypothetical protein